MLLKTPVSAVIDLSQTSMNSRRWKSTVGTNFFAVIQLEIPSTSWHLPWAPRNWRVSHMSFGSLLVALLSATGVPRDPEVGILVR